MVRAGLIAALALAAAGATGCRDASADGAPPPAPGATTGPAALAPTPGEVLGRLHVEPPAGWQRLPAVEAAAIDAAAKITAATTAAEAWGDPGAGCYAIAIDTRGKIAEPVAASLTRLTTALAPLGVDPKTVTTPTGDIVDVELPVATGELAGSVRIRMLRTAEKLPQAAALVCAGNAREPVRCKTQCQALIAQMAPPVAP